MLTPTRQGPAAVSRTTSKTPLPLPPLALLAQEHCAPLVIQEPLKHVQHVWAMPQSWAPPAPATLASMRATASA